MQHNCKSKDYLRKCNNVALKKSGYMKQTRNTKAKAEILALIRRSDTALSHAEIQQALTGLCDRVTIYRVLERLLTETIHRMVTPDGIVKYAACRHCAGGHQHNHIHFSCLQCKSVTCLENVEPAFQLPKQYKISEVNFMVSGWCPRCA